MFRPASLHYVSEFLFGADSNAADLDDLGRGRLRAAQIGTVVQLVPMTMTINVLNAVILVYLFWDSAPRSFLLPWAALLLSISALSLWSWSRTRHKKPTKASARAINRMIVHAGLLGLVWGVLPIILFHSADVMLQLILSCLIAGMISGGAFCLSPVRRAGLAYTWTLVLGAETGLLLAEHPMFRPVGLLLVLYAVFISHHIAARSRVFAEHLCVQLKLEAQGDLIKLLLNDFQENASDWLWEADVGGTLTHVSDRFAEAARKSSEDMEGVTLGKLIGGAFEFHPPQLVEIINYGSSGNRVGDFRV